MNELIQTVERRQARRLPPFRVGDRVRVHFQVVEGNRRRTQVFEGVVLKQQGSGTRRTFTVRKLSFGVGVERTFPMHSPKIERVEVMGRGEVRRAKLYYLRGRVGRRARVRESRDFRPEDVMASFDAELEAERAAASDGAADEVEAVAEEAAGEQAEEAATPEQAEEAQAAEEAETPPEGDAETQAEGQTPAEGEAAQAEDQSDSEPPGSDEPQKSGEDEEESESA
jgi:large subunit ribosomal protein L19